MKTWKKWHYQLLDLDQRTTQLGSYVATFCPNYYIINDKESVDGKNYSIFNNDQLTALGLINDSDTYIKLFVHKLKYNCGIINNFNKEVRIFTADNQESSDAILPPGYVILSKADDELHRADLSNYQMLCSTPGGAYFTISNRYDSAEQVHQLVFEFDTNAVQRYGSNYIFSIMRNTHYVYHTTSWYPQSWYRMSDYIAHIDNINDNNQFAISTVDGTLWTDWTLCADPIVQLDDDTVHELIVGDVLPINTPIFDKVNKLRYTMRVKNSGQHPGQMTTGDFYMNIW